jgi:hypothetical protein
MTSREVFETGAQRDSSASKPRPELIELDFLTHVALEVQLHVGDGEPLFTAPAALAHVLTTKAEDINYPAIAAAVIVHSTDLDLPTAYMNGAQGISLIPYDMIARIGNVLRFGAEHYGERNWQLGMPIERTKQSLVRHMWAWQRELYFDDAHIEDTDDHAAASFINCMFLWFFVNGREPMT